jgi:hypothetical protein
MCVFCCYLLDISNFQYYRLLHKSEHQTKVTVFRDVTSHSFIDSNHHRENLKYHITKIFQFFLFYRN